MKLAEPPSVLAVDVGSIRGRIEHPNVLIRRPTRPSGRGRQARGDNRGETEVERNGTAPDALRREPYVPEPTRTLFEKASSAPLAFLNVETANAPTPSSCPNGPSQPGARRKAVTDLTDPIATVTRARPSSAPRKQHST
jgi:hypothetical protein